MMGTAWVDEQDRVLVKAEGHFVNNFKIGGGMVANIQKGTNFAMERERSMARYGCRRDSKVRVSAISAAFGFQWAHRSGSIGLSEVQGDFDDSAGESSVLRRRISRLRREVRPPSVDNNGGGVGGQGDGMLEGR